MKRPKRAVPTEKKFMDSIFSVVCPHCKTKLTGGINKDIDRLFCWAKDMAGKPCGNVIILDWQD